MKMLAVSVSRPFHLVRLCPCFPAVFSSSTLKRVENVYRPLCTLAASPKPKRKLNPIFIPNLMFNYMCSSYFPASVAKDPGYVERLNVKLAPLENTIQHLELFASVKEFASVGDKVHILFKMAKIAEVDTRQRKLLEKERQTSQQGLASAYVELLDNISDAIFECNSRNLANLLWALGKIQERNHKVVEICEKEILLRGIAAFNMIEICQIVNGCSNLRLTASDVFVMLEDAILNKNVNVKSLETRELSGILLAFSKTDYGFVEVFQVLLEEIISRNLSLIESRALAEFVWAFAKKDFKAEKLFLRVEEEIMRRGMSEFDNAAFAKTLWAFGMAETGTKQFFYFLDHEIVSRGVDTFDNSLLLEIVWSFKKRNITQAKVFDIVERQVYKRGVHTFKVHELVLILYSFVSAQRHNDALVAEIEFELCTRDAKQFTKGDLCQIAWSLGRAGKSKSHLFDIIEAEILQRGVDNLPSKGDRFLMLMRGFIEANRGTKELYKFLAHYFCRTDFRNLKESGICECAWCFSQVGTEVGEVFDLLGKEIRQRNKYVFSDFQVALLKKSFRKVGKDIDSKQLLNL